MYDVHSRCTNLQSSMRALRRHHLRDKKINNLQFFIELYGIYSKLHKYCLKMQLAFKYPCQNCGQNACNQKHVT